MDNFTLAVLLGALLVFIIFGIIFWVDMKGGKSVEPPTVPTGKKSA